MLFRDKNQYPCYAYYFWTQHLYYYPNKPDEKLGRSHGRAQHEKSLFSPIRFRSTVASPQTFHDFPKTLKTKSLQDLLSILLHVLVFLSLLRDVYNLQNASLVCCFFRGENYVSMIQGKYLSEIILSRKQHLFSY